jgi:hypothetical protein
MVFLVLSSCALRAISWFRCKIFKVSVQEFVGPLRAGRKEEQNIMWLMTPQGFFSAVQHKDDPDKIMVRTRAKMHAQRLVEALPEGERPPVVETPPPADYRWRVTVTRAQWVYLVAKYAAEIAYGNFKNEAHQYEHPTGFVSALHRVWADLQDFQDDLHAKKGQKGRLSLPAPRKSTSDSDVFGDLDHWLGRHKRPDPADETEYDWLDETEDSEGMDLKPGMWVRLCDDEELGDGVVQSVDANRGTAVVVFTTTYDDGTKDEDELEVRIDDLWILIDPEVAEELADEICSTKPEPDVYDDIDLLAEEDDGSWPSPVLGGPLRGR